MCGFVCALFLVVFQDVSVFHVCAFFIFSCHTRDETKAGECLQLLQTEDTWKTSEKFTMCLAALTTCYPHEASRRSDKKKKTRHWHLRYTPRDPHSDLRGI